MELILYYIKESASLLISFLILIFVLGFFAYMTMRNFRQDSKLKVGFYGLFLGLKNVDIIKLSIVIIRIFLVYYSVMITAKEKIFICLIMIGILSIIYIILTPKKIISEIICTVMEIVMIYFIYIVNSYMIDIEFSMIILMVKICLLVFTILLSTYFLLRNIVEVVDYRWKIEFKNRRKDLKDEK